MVRQDSAHQVIGAMRWQCFAKCLEVLRQTPCLCGVVESLAQNSPAREARLCTQGGVAHERARRLSELFGTFHDDPAKLSVRCKQPLGSHRGGNTWRSTP